MHPVLFDFNGTLYNDKRFHIAAWKRYLKRRFGFDLTDAEAQGLVGPSNYTIFHSYLDVSLTEEEIEICSQEKESAYREAARENPENMRLINGAPEALDYLVREGVPFALATASVAENVMFYREDLGIKKWFPLEKIVYEDGSDLPGKPDPAYYLEAARRIGADIHDCVIMEDSPAGIEAARRAGPWRLIVIDTITDAETLSKQPGIYAVIHDFVGFEKFLQD